jgi:hypothetical protein
LTPEICCSPLVSDFSKHDPESSGSFRTALHSYMETLLISCISPQDQIVNSGYGLKKNLNLLLLVLLQTLDLGHDVTTQPPNFSGDAF